MRAAGGEHHQLTLPAPAAWNELLQMEAGHQQPEAGQRQPQATDAHAHHQRIVEVHPLAVIHDVQHPEDVEQPPRRVAVLHHLAAVRGHIDGAVLCITEIHAPHRVGIGTRFQRLLQVLRCRRHAIAAIRGLRHAQRQCGVDINALPIPGVDHLGAFRRLQAIHRLLQQPTAVQRCRRMFGRAQCLRGRHGIRRPCRHVHLRGTLRAAFDLVRVQQTHHQATTQPHHELQADQQAHPLVQGSHPGRHAGLRLPKL
ncbi:hypothetical protein D3C71_858160 [compost metagenome]